MSYHNDPYQIDYLKIYPCLKERPDVLEVLKKSDRKMKYMEVNAPGWNRQFDRARPTPLPLKSYTLSASPTPSV